MDPSSGIQESILSEGANPFRAPDVTETVKAIPADAAELAKAIQIREEHLRHETSLKSIGALFLLVGAFFGIAGLYYLFEATQRRANLPIAAVVPLLGLMLLFVTTGIYVRLLSRWAWLPLGAILFLGLLLFPLGTLINGYVIYLFLCRKGRTVFAPSYHRVILLTPQLEYRTSPVLLAMLAMVAILIIVGGIVILFGVPPGALFT